MRAIGNQMQPASGIDALDLLRETSSAQLKIIRSQIETQLQALSNVEATISDAVQSITAERLMFEGERRKMLEDLEAQKGGANGMLQVSPDGEQGPRLAAAEKKREELESLVDVLARRVQELTSNLTEGGVSRVASRRCQLNQLRSVLGIWVKNG